MKNRLVALIAMVAVITGLSSCLKNNVTPAPRYTVIAFINGATPSYKMDLYFNTKKADFNISFTSAGASEFQPNIYKIDFTKSGGDSLLTSVTANFDTTKYHTILIYGTNPIKSFVYKEDFTTISQTKANVRFFNMVENTQVDFYINATKVSPGRQWEDFLGSMSFQATDAANVTITAKDAVDGTELATIPDVPLQAYNAYSVTYMGIKGNTGDRKPVIKIVRH